jgi:hypothetical protein
VGFLDVDELFPDETVPVQREYDGGIGAGDCRERDGHEGKVGRSELAFNPFEYAHEPEGLLASVTLKKSNIDATALLLTPKAAES